MTRNMGPGEHTHSSRAEGGASLSPEELNDAVWVTDAFPGGDIGARFNAARDEYPNTKAVRIPPGVYTVTTPLDLTSNRDFTEGELDIRGVTLQGETSGEPVIDTTGSRNIRFYGGRIQGMGSNTPNIGVLQARDDSGASTGDDRFLGTMIDGEFTIAPVYNFGAEVCTYWGVRFLNDIGDGMKITRANQDGVTSPYVTIASGARSTNDMFIGGGSTLKTFANDASSAALYNSAGWLVTVRDTLLLSDSRAHIINDTAESTVDVPKVDNCRFHPTGKGNAASGVEYLDSSGGAGANVNAAGVINSTFSGVNGPLVTTDGNPNLQNGFMWFGNRPTSGDAPDLSGATVQQPFVVDTNLGYSGDATFIIGNAPQGGLLIGRDFDVQNGGNGVMVLDGGGLSLPFSSADANDGMTANPETDTESGYLEVDVGGLTKQIPLYDA